jgi:hypothetical protein
LEASGWTFGFGALGLVGFALRSGEAMSVDLVFTLLSADAGSFTFIFLAPLLRIFSSSSDDGYDESLIASWTLAACWMSRLASCANVPNDGGRLMPAVVSLWGDVTLTSFGGGMGARKASGFLTRCTRGSGKASLPPIEREEAEVKDILEEVR